MTRPSTRLQEEAPGSGDGHEHADAQLPRGRGTAGDLAPPSELVQPLAPGAHTCVWK